jgi:hypothetical protein
MKHVWRCHVGAALGLYLLLNSVNGAPPPGAGSNGGAASAAARAGVKGRPSGHEPAHIHVNASLRGGTEAWSVVASPSGRFPVVVNHESETLLINLNVPQVLPGRIARVTLNHHGWLAPATTRVGPVGHSRTLVGRWLAPQRVITPQTREDAIDVNAWQGTRMLDLRVAADRTVAFHFHYGENKHAQQIDVTVDGRRYRFELHLHLPGDAAH